MEYQFYYPAASTRQKRPPRKRGEHELQLQIAKILLGVRERVVPRTSEPHVPFDIPSGPAPIIKQLPTWEKVSAVSTKGVVQHIVPYLVDTGEANQAIYFDGWRGLGASAVLTCVADDPPPALRRRFERIIHIDCSRWKNRRALQRTIAQELSLAQNVMDIFNRQDEEDDFSGVDEDSRVEIEDVSREIHQALQGQSCLVVFNNGSKNAIDFNDFGIPQPSDRWSTFIQKVLWTFRGRLCAIPGIRQTTDKNLDHKMSGSTSEFTNAKDSPIERVDNSHIYLYSDLEDSESESWNELVREEAKQIAQYTHKVGVTPEAAGLCCKYMLSLNSKGVRILEHLDYNWATHASNYWVCDGIIQECQQDNAWEVATALHEELRLEDFSSHRLPSFGDTTRWIVATNFHTAKIKPKTTSFFWENVSTNIGWKPLPGNLFQTSEQLHVLKLRKCTFSFSSPPFLHCRNLRFLGLDSCKDQSNKQEDNNKEKEEEKDIPQIQLFQSLWVLDMSYTDWELNLSPNVNIREISIKRGRIWHNTHTWAWRHLQNIHKLRVIEPTSPWETGRKDQFTGMVKLELLDLSGNSTMQVLPSLFSATSLKILVLDGCIGLEKIAPGTLPQSLEEFNLDASTAMGHDKEAKISHISMSGCTRLVNFRLRGFLRNLKDLDLSNTSIKELDLRDDVVQVPSLERTILLGCERLRAILWPEDGVLNLKVLCIDTTKGGTEVAGSKEPQDYFLSKNQDKGHVHVVSMDMRFLQSLVLPGGKEFCWRTHAKLYLNLCLSSTSKDGGQNNNKKMMEPYRNLQLVESPLDRSLGPKSHRYRRYNDINFDKATITCDGCRANQIEALDVHVEIGQGIGNTNVVTLQGTVAVTFLMNKIKSLIVHDNSSITTVTPMMSKEEERISWSGLQWCRVERCPKLDSVFICNYDDTCFHELETFWAADLLMTRCIWTKGRASNSKNISKSFAKLKAMHVQFCPRLAFVLPLSWFTLSNLETLHIVCCGDITQLFPVEAKFLKELAAAHRRGVLEFPKLKHICLYELPKLHQISEAKMFAPELKSIMVRGCWSLKRLPATTVCQDDRPIVNCERDWWQRLEWDGKEAAHHPSLFEPCHSKYYKKTMIRGSVLI